MLDCKNEDFEFYRLGLQDYALRLLYVRGSGNTKSEEFIHKSKDIVQETYIVFHKGSKDIFVTKQHLKNWLNIVLFKKYQESVSPMRKASQHSILRGKELLYLTDKEIPYNDPVDLDSKNELELLNSEDFKRFLTPSQEKVLDLLIEGLNQVEIAEKLKISKQGVFDHLKRVRTKFKEYNDK